MWEDPKVFFSISFHLKCGIINAISVFLISSLVSQMVFSLNYMTSVVKSLPNSSSLECHLFKNSSSLLPIDGSTYNCFLRIALKIVPVSRIARVCHSNDVIYRFKRSPVVLSLVTAGITVSVESGSKRVLSFTCSIIAALLVSAVSVLFNACSIVACRGITLFVYFC